MASAKYLFIGWELVSAAVNCKSQWDQFPKIILYDYDSYEPVQALLTSSDITHVKHCNLEPAVDRGRKWTPPRISSDQTVSLLYTSGTTGKPKAVMMPAVWVFLRLLFPAVPVIGPSTPVYCCLPLFHGVGMYGGTLVTLGASAPLILARKFSISKFWFDIERTRATGFMYVGELCRYIVQAPKSAEETLVLERGHLKFAKGLGMNARIWEQLVERLNISVCEYYSASEATITLSNYSSSPFTVGAVAKIGLLGRLFNNSWVLVRHDVDTGEVIRDPKTGLCIPCKLGEPGEIVETYNDDQEPFHGYFGNEKATTEKKLRDVLKKGDSWLRLGDLLVLDKDGLLRFQDRLGDTYRSKGIT